MEINRSGWDETRCACCAFATSFCSSPPLLPYLNSTINIIQLLFITNGRLTYTRVHYESGHDIHFYTGVERNLAHEGSRDSELRFCVEITEGVLGPFRTLAPCLFSVQKNSRWTPCGGNILMASEKRSHDCCCCRRSSWTLPPIVWDEILFFKCPFINDVDYTTTHNLRNEETELTERSSCAPET